MDGRSITSMYFRLWMTPRTMKIISCIFWNSDIRQSRFPRKSWPWCCIVAHYSSPVQEVWISKSIHSETLHIRRRTGINGEKHHFKYCFNSSFAIVMLNIKVKWIWSTKRLNNRNETVGGPSFSLPAKNYTDLCFNILGICSSCVLNPHRIQQVLM